MALAFGKARLGRLSVLGSAASLILTACASGDGQRQDPIEVRVGNARAQLTRVDSCGELLARVQDNLVAQLAERATQLRQGYDTKGGGGVAIGSDDSASPPVQGPTGAPPMTANPNSPSDPVTTPTPGSAPPRGDAESPGAGGASSGNGAGAGDFSGTTVQVKDVDEADILKADGDRLFLLHGGTLFVLKAWPAESTEVLGSALLEGSPTEMFVKDGKAVVFTSVYGVPGFTPSASNPGYGYYYPSWGFTKLTVLDVTGATPSVVAEHYVEGGYVSARRHDDLVRAVVQDGFKIPQINLPSIEYVDPFGNRYPQADIDEQVNAWLDRVERSIANAELTDFLPREFTVKNGSAVENEPRCGDYYAPDPGLTESGVTSVVSLDLASGAAALGGATILGNAERVYANSDALLVTQTDYRYRSGATSSEQTVIHRFDLDGARTTYVASGFVAGTVNDQFSIDEQGGIVRLSITENRWNNGGGATPDIAMPPPNLTPTPGMAPAREPAPQAVILSGPVSRVVTLGRDGDGLVQLGASEDFGQNERIYATRFVGDKAYVVTFRRTDPFFVIDLSDPANPHKVGELKIPGFSNFLFPLDADHVFAIGQEATPEGIVQGLALQIFDVSDPTNPELAFGKYVFPEPGASLANVDHRAISFHSEQDLVAFPYQSYTTGQSSLEVFRISPTDGITRLGAMASGTEIGVDECLDRLGYPEGTEYRAAVVADAGLRDNLLLECRYNFRDEFRRGVFRDDVVYGITSAGVYAYGLDALGGAPLGSVSLPPMVYDEGKAMPGNVLPTMGGATPGMATPPVSAGGAPAGMEPAPAGGAGGAGGAMNADAP